MTPTNPRPVTHSSARVEGGYGRPLISVEGGYARPHLPLTARSILPRIGRPERKTLERLVWVEEPKRVWPATLPLAGPTRTRSVGASPT